MSYGRFIAIDWSGARQPGYRGVAVAACEADGRLSLVDPPEGRRWRRTTVLEWLNGALAGDVPLMIGFDFAFALPFDEVGGFLPDSGHHIRTPPGLWAFVDDLCQEQPDLYAGSLTDDPRLTGLFWRQGRRPAGFAERHRLTETACRAAGFGQPQSVFKLIGAAQVGKGSLAGMRLLHRLQRHPNLSLWPFAPAVSGKSVCVEIYPALFMARLRRRGKVRETATLRAIVRELGAKDDGLPAGPIDDHGCDALVSAAALRYYAPQDGHWHPAAMTASARRAEGWIFGLA